MASPQAAPTPAGAPRLHRLTLRPRTPTDADALFPTMANPEMSRWWSRAAFDHVDDLRAYFANDDQSTWQSWAIVRTGEQHAIGFVAAGQKREGVSEIGYLLAQEMQGQGYAREAVTMLIDQLFAEGQRRPFRGYRS